MKPFKCPRCKSKMKRVDNANAFVEGKKTQMYCIKTVCSRCQSIFVSTEKDRAKATDTMRKNLDKVNQI